MKRQSREEADVSQDSLATPMIKATRVPGFNFGDDDDDDGDDYDGDEDEIVTTTATGW